MTPPAAKPMRPRGRVAGFPSRRPDEATVETKSDQTAAAPSTAAVSEPAPQDAPSPATPSGAAATAAAPVATVDAPTESDHARAKRQRSSREPTTRRTPQAPSGEDVSQPGGFRNQTNFRLYESEMSYLRRLKREFEDDEVKTDITELVHALIYTARRGELDTLEILRRWRKDLNEF